MEITAVLTTLDYGHLAQTALRSLEGEADSAVVLVSSEADAAAARKDCPVDCTIHTDPDLPGLSETRNIGAGLADGDVVAFIDDDVEVEDGWGDALRVAFRDGAPAAGGPAYPTWETSRPAHLTREWDWLVGCGPYHDRRTEVRNTYGCNIAFDADVFEGLGGFDTDYGFDGDLGQGEEAEVCGRMIEEHGRGTEYMPGASVRHYVLDGKARYGRLLRRCWAQGATKAGLGLDDEETGFLREAVSAALRERPVAAAGSLSFLAATGSGYLAEKASRRA